MSSVPFRLLGNRWLVGCLDRTRLGEAVAEKVLQPPELTDLGARGEVDLFRIQFDAAPPPVTTRYPIFLGQLADAEAGCGFGIDSATSAEPQLLRFCEVDPDPVLQPVEGETDVVPPGRFSDRDFARPRGL